MTPDDGVRSVLEDAHVLTSHVETRRGRIVDKALATEAGDLRARIDAVLGKERSKQRLSGLNRTLFRLLRE